MTELPVGCPCGCGASEEQFCWHTSEWEAANNEVADDKHVPLDVSDL